LSSLLLASHSGGYNLKVGPSSQIELMKFDMGGCAAVLGAAKAIAELQPDNLEVHFISAVCENMISAEAMKPGDILKTSNGKTIEVLNTDAEGRLTLADALVYAEKLEVDAMIDLATLTGACVMGLGNKVAAVYSADEEFRNSLMESSKRSEDKLWPLPLEASYKESVKSTIADLKNIAGIQGGGSITAALFLQEFVEKTPWAHIDMAGPVWDDAAKGPTGYGVKLLVDFLLNAKKSSFKK
jgi:leucyl aminopeptidase